eukprot:1187545-Prorocentrum_minimum.AAC.9
MGRYNLPINFCKTCLLCTPGSTRAEAGGAQGEEVLVEARLASQQPHGARAQGVRLQPQPRAHVAVHERVQTRREGG